MSKNKLLNGQVGSFTDEMASICNHNFKDRSLLATELDITSSNGGATLQNLTGMKTDVLTPGATYNFKIRLPMVCTANNGSKFAFKQGAASMIASIEYEAFVCTASGSATTRGTTTTDQALISDNASAVAILTEIEGVVTLNNTVALQAAKANGTLTLQLQAAEHTSHADTLSIFKNAYMEFEHLLPTG